MQFVDLDGNPLAEGDTVLSLRYDLGKCIIKAVDNGFEYESIESKKTLKSVLIESSMDEWNACEVRNLRDTIF